MENSETWNESGEALLDKWIKRSRENQHSHHEAGKYYKTLNRIYAVPIIIINGIVSGFAVYYLGKDVPDFVIIAFGLSGIITTLVTTIQAYYKFPEISEKHSSLGAKYGFIRRELEQVKALPKNARGNAKEVLDSLRGKMDNLGSENSVVDRGIFTKTIKRLKKEDEEERIG